MQRDKTERVTISKETELDKIFLSLSNTTRRSIISLLVSRDLTVGVIAKNLNIGIATTSKHIQVLLNSGLVTQTKVGKHKICKVNIIQLADANVWLSSVGLLDPLDISNLEDFFSKKDLFS